MALQPQDKRSSNLLCAHACQSSVARLRIKERILREDSQSPSLSPGAPRGPELPGTSDGETWTGEGGQAAKCRGSEMTMSWEITPFLVGAIKLLMTCLVPSSPISVNRDDS